MRRTVPAAQEGIAHEPFVVFGIPGHLRCHALTAYVQTELRDYQHGDPKRRQETQPQQDMAETGRRASSQSPAANDAVLPQAAWRFTVMPRRRLDEGWLLAASARHQTITD
jgi:hypothetical protein